MESLRFQPIFSTNAQVNNRFLLLAWDKLKIAQELWKDLNTLISDEMVDKVNTAHAYLKNLQNTAFELGGIKADGNCFLNAFLESYKSLQRKIPLLDEQKDLISYLRSLIAKQYEGSPNGSKYPNRSEQIRVNGEWISADNEGDLLANILSIPIRILTVDKHGTSDMLTFPEYNRDKQSWDTLTREEAPKEYIFIVDLGGHFIYVKAQQLYLYQIVDEKGTKDEEIKGLELQNQWKQRHIEMVRPVEPSDPLFNPRAAQLNIMPHPELYHLYLRANDKSSYALSKDQEAKTNRSMRLYTNGTSFNYTTMSLPSTRTPKETYISPRTPTFGGSRKYPTASSTSYPPGVHTFYIRINGKKIRLDRGHGVSHADTLEHRGLISTLDSENYVPQNIKYNSPIRRDLEEDLRSERLTYKEISIYHEKSEQNVTARVKGKDKDFRLPIPEGFLVIVFSKELQAIRTYYFPNLVDYEELIGNAPDYKHFRELYRIEDLSDWLLIPEVTVGKVEDQQHKVDLASSTVGRIVLFSKNIFKKFSESQMPPRARVALCATLLEWNKETAATLEFLTLEKQIQLAYFYLNSRRKFWELDDRYESEKMIAVRKFLTDTSISQTARGVVGFLNTQILNRHINFENIQDQLEKIANMLEDICRNAPHRLEMSDFFPIEYRLTCNKDSYVYNITKMSPSDAPKIRELIGGMDNSSLDRAKYILSCIDARARKQSTSVIEKLHLMRLYHDYNYLSNEKMHTYWETELYKQIEVAGKAVSLLDLRLIADYYSYRNIEVKKAEWLQKFLLYIQEDLSIDHFIDIADWCFTGRAAFLQDLEEQVDQMRPCNMLALQIYKGLHFFGF